MKAHVLMVLGSLVLAPATARAQDTVVYYHTDAIGSVRAITDSTGAEIARYDYLPFGELWPASPPAPADVRQFAGKERDSNTELDYFGARHYRYQSGRFTTVDPVLNIDAALTDPQRWNRYTYVRNNPFRYVDPDGRAIESLWDVFNIGLGVGSFVSNIREGAYVSAAVDAVGVVIDAGAAAVPFIPGGASSAIRALRGLEHTGDLASSGRRLLPFKDADRINEVNRTLDRIESGGPFAHAKDGVVFRNREGKLPGRNDSDYYREYTVNTQARKTEGLNGSSAGRAAKRTTPTITTGTSSRSIRGKFRTRRNTADASSRTAEARHLGMRPLWQCGRCVAGT